VAAIKEKYGEDE